MVIKRLERDSDTRRIDKSKGPRLYQRIEYIPCNVYYKRDQKALDFIKEHSICGTIPCNVYSIRGRKRPYTGQAAGMMRSSVGASRRTTH